MQNARILQRTHEVEFNALGWEPVEQPAASAEQHRPELNVDQVQYPGLQTILPGVGTCIITFRSPAARLACCTQEAMPSVT